MSGELDRFRQELSSASRAFKAVAVDELRAVRVHAGQNFLLEALSREEPLTTGELARRLHVEVPTIVRMTQRMETAGLLARRTDPSDRRRALITLTKEGRRAAKAIPRLLDKVSEDALRGLNRSERRTLIDLLARVSANLDWPPETR